MVGKQIQDQDADGNLLVDGAGDPIMIDETKEVVKQVPVYGKKWVITDETQQKIVLGKYTSRSGVGKEMAPLPRRPEISD